MGRRISKEFLHPSILEGVNNKIGNLDSLETDAKGNMVQAINELVEKLDNSAEIESGKELIANAVGEPLTAEDSFDEMSSDINSLLSTFKTNMMNNGVTVESSDKFKSLIDKIATMVEEGSGKGIQYTSGVSTVSVPGEATTVTIPFNETLNYIPNIVFVRVKYYQGSSVYFDGWLSNNQSLSLNVSGYGIAKLTVDNVTEEQLRVDVYTGNTNYLFLNTSSSSKNIDFSWYAIGVGEEDTTLRDSLADILENKGVDVTEEDDMASLITKVDDTLDSLGGSDIKQIAYSMRDYQYQTTENQFMFIVKNDGSLWACGRNDFGQLGLGDTTTRYKFTQVTTNINNDVKEVICGYRHAIIIKNDGSLWGCGYNGYPALGLGNTTDKNTFTKITTNINNDVKQVACGQTCTIILKNDGSIWGCGRCYYGELGLGTEGTNNTIFNKFTKITTNINNDVKYVSCNNFSTFIIKTDDSIWACGKNEMLQFGDDNSTIKTVFTKLC